MKKMLMVLMMLCLMLCAGSAMAEKEPVFYIERDWYEGSPVTTERKQTDNDYVQVIGGPGNQDWGNKWIVVMPGEQVTIDGQVIVPVGTVNLVLCDDANLTVKDGIVLQAYTQLCIYGQEAHSGTLNAQITTSGLFSSVRICGGTVNATKDGTGAAIGGGDGGDGIVTILGGTVNATNNGSGAAIGGGTSGSNVTILGGTVNATNNDDGAAINRNVYIYGGNITAKGGKGMPGVGDGRGNVIIYGSKTNVLTAKYGVRNGYSGVEWSELEVYSSDTTVTADMWNDGTKQYDCFHLERESIPEENPPENPAKNPEKTPEADLPQTGDASNLMGWVCLLAMCAGAGLVMKRARA